MQHLCECGCRRVVVGRRSTRKYHNRACRDRAFRRRRDPEVGSPQRRARQIEGLRQRYQGYVRDDLKRVGLISDDPAADPGTDYARFTQYPDKPVHGPGWDRGDVLLGLGTTLYTERERVPTETGYRRIDLSGAPYSGEPSDVYEEAKFYGEAGIKGKEFKIVGQLNLVRDRQKHLRQLREESDKTERDPRPWYMPEPMVPVSDAKPYRGEDKSSPDSEESMPTTLQHDADTALVTALVAGLDLQRNILSALEAHEKRLDEYDQKELDRFNLSAGELLSEEGERVED